MTDSNENQVENTPTSFRMFEAPSVHTYPTDISDRKKIIAYKVNEKNDIEIGRGRLTRYWMDESTNKFAYRCLPLNIANMHGWAFYSNRNIIVEWNGKEGINDVKIIDPEENHHIASSHFGHGILTFYINHLIRLPEDYDLYITGAPNHFIPGAHPLSGIYEADWAPYSFTMNWKLTDPCRKIVFKKDDPICFIFPVKRNLIEEFSFEVRDLNTNEELKKSYEQFSTSRNDFIKSMHDGTIQEQWQKNYFQGKMPDGSRCPIQNHQTKLSLNLEEK